MNTFLEDFYEESVRTNYPKELRRTPGSIAGKVWGVLVVIDVNSDEIHLVRLETPRRFAGQGYGRKALRWLCRLADRHGLEIWLQAISGFHRLLTNEELHAWYLRQGFQPSRNSWLTRKPNTKENHK